MLLFLSLSLCSSVSSCHKNEHTQASTHAHLHIISECSDTTLRIATVEDHFTVPLPPRLSFFSEQSMLAFLPLFVPILTLLYECMFLNFEA